MDLSVVAPDTLSASNMEYMLDISDDSIAQPVGKDAASAMHFKPQQPVQKSQISEEKKGDDSDEDILGALNDISRASMDTQKMFGTPMEPDSRLNVSQRGRGRGRGKGRGQRGNNSFVLGFDRRAEGRGQARGGFDTSGRGRKALGAATLASLQEVESDISFVLNQSQLSDKEKWRKKQEQISQMRVEMPLTFVNKDVYLNKLKELIHTEGEVDKYNIEQIADTNIQFKFLEQLKIFCKLEMHVPVTLSKHVRENAVLDVVIPIIGEEPYRGKGTVKKVKLRPKNPLMNVTLQIDI